VRATGLGKDGRAITAEHGGRLLSPGRDEPWRLDDASNLDERLGLVGSVSRQYGAHQTVLDPREIRLKKATQWPEYVKWWPSLVCWGDWDLTPPGEGPFKEELIAEYLQQNVPHRETTRYRQMVADLGQHGVTLWPSRACHSLDEIDRYLLGLRQLYERIRSEGYQGRGGDPVAREITVRVGRDGSFTKCGQGTHRFAIARMLGLPAVPVVVDLVHWEWALDCRERRGGSLAEAMRAELAAIAQRTVGGRGDSREVPSGPA
jgi:hypothetical protein